jgi:hypothetical protein
MLQVDRSDRRRRWYLRWRSLLTAARIAEPPMPRAVPPADFVTTWDRFRRDSGIIAGVTLELLRRDGCRIVIPLVEPFTLIGSGRHCGVQLDDLAVDDLQAAFFWHSGRLWLIDHTSQFFGPMTDGAPRTWRWGSWTATVSGVPTAIMRQPHILGGPLPVLDWTALVAARPTPLSQPITLFGSAPACTVRLADPSLAPFHAALIRTERGLWLVNLTAPKRTTVNYHPATFAAVDPGDTIAFGNLMAVVATPWSDEGTPAAASPAIIEQQARIAELEVRLARLKQTLSAGANAEAELTEVESLTTALERI